MFCPVCKDEFRPGFTRCGSCDVDLVDSLDRAAGHPASAAAAAAVAQPVPAAQLYVPMVEYCGFLTLEDARGARDDLKGRRIRSEIVIREAPASLRSDTVEEEYWLRVERDRYREAVNHLGFDEADSKAPDETFTCGECGTEVVSEESFCPNCGARFEDD